MGLLDFVFSPSKIKTTSFDQLRERIVKLRKENIYPFTFNFPQAISFPSDFWDELIRIYRNTRSDGLERSFSLFWADGEVIFTEVKTGSDKMVKSGGSISVKYSHHPTKKEYARKELYIDDKLIKKRDIYYRSVPKTLDVQYLFNIHTHPVHVNEKGNNYYNFFSAQDIKSLISSKAIMTGLITDKLWILIRSNKTPDNLDNLLDSSITPQYLEDTLQIGVYTADFNKKAFRFRLLNTK